MQYWLMKSEPDVFGIDDLQKVAVEPWDGVRNYQARNMMRDQMQVGDQVFFYHSNCDIPGIVGIASIATQGYPDDTAFNPEAKYFDPKSDPQNPSWYRVDVQFVRKLKRTISLRELREQTALQNMPLVQKGCRLSVMPVSAEEWQTILVLE
ncbi:Predicted RNA-binding protein, contains PUA-like domain [Thiothrix caldifontis]|uniref:Predicted RNA-binding protein, contains PUA-like domain n=1 Tax=Thiothrix caldifontis TaxID=525918 RepID=A0A1H4FQA6_9GAMM|nr:EVE domain-containing protein [Thiothrix caldifontis]SEA99465.1 Predicted RNA-binding protein, contains PUA-like domain [Thiothrix caldifontis]